MTTLDARFRALALSMLDKYGKVAVLTPVLVDSTGSTYDTTTGTVAPDDGEDVPTKGLVVQARTTKGREFVRQGAIALDVPAVSFAVEPKPGDRVTFNSLVWLVLDLDTIWSGEQAALHTLYLKRT